MESFRLTHERLARWHRLAQEGHAGPERTACRCCQYLDEAAGWETVARWLEARGFMVFGYDAGGITVGCAGFTGCNALYHAISGAGRVAGLLGGRRCPM